MKRKVYTGIAAALLTSVVTVGIAGQGFAAETRGANQKLSQPLSQQVAAATTNKNTGTTSLIGAIKAAEIAKNKVGGQVVSVELERERNAVFYEVELEKGTKEWDVKVDAKTGKVLHTRSEIDRDQARDHIRPSQAKITKEQAITAATKELPGQALQVSWDREDGRYVAEVTVLTDKGTFEVEIDAVTGKVVRDDDDDNYKEDRYDDDRYDDDDDND